jgi:L-aminopeptidase/D-esterase-like protein
VTDMSAVAARLRAAYQDAIAAGEIGAGSGMAGPWVFVGRFVSQDGVRDTALVCDADADLPDVLGLLDVGQVNWREATRQWLTSDEETT